MNARAASAPAPRPPPPSRRRRDGGFALLITVTLLAFLVLLLVSLATLTRVETQVATNSQSLARARQNALMALNLALGQLQKFTGPDQVATAAANLQIPPSVSIGATTTGASARATLDAFWGASRNGHWTGVWRNANTAAFDKDNPSGYNAQPSVPVWLVSGNENASVYAPTDVVSGLTPASTALQEIPDANGKPHRLLVKASADVTDATSLDRAVTAPQVEIKSDAVPGGAAGTVIGHYAWWVGDEGVKARANLIDAYAGDATTDGKLTRFQAAQRPAIEAMTVNDAASPTGDTDADGLAPYYRPNLPALSSALARSQLPLTLGNPPAAYDSQLRSRFHDLSMTSRGVLADSRHGGLKRDLTYLLGQADLAAFRTALNAAYDGGGAAPASTYNPILSTAVTPYAEIPSGGSAKWSWTASPGIWDYSATWEQLWSFANLGNGLAASPAGVFDGSGAAVPRLQTGVQHGLYPLLIQAKLFFRLRIVGGAPDADGANRSGLIWVDVVPVVVLANPYDAPLAAADYNVRFVTNNISVRFAAPPDGDDPPSTADTTAFSEAAQSILSTNGFTGAGTRLVLRSTGFAPGEARIFTIDPSSSANPGIGADAEDCVTITSQTADTRTILFKDDFDPVPAITWNTGKAIPSTPPTEGAPIPTHVALFSTTSSFDTKLYLDYDKALGDQRLIQFNHPPGLADSTNTVVSNFFFVNPIQNGIRQGGGISSVVTEAPTTATPTTPNDRRPQQAPFLQVNYRAIIDYPIGDSSGAHLETRARTYVKSGDTGSVGTEPNPFIEADLLHTAGDLDRVRWGLANMGAGYFHLDPPAYLDADAGFVNLLYDLPHPGHPLSSLGQLQHFNTTGHVDDIPGTDLTAAATWYPVVTHDWQVNWPVANSYPQPRIPRDQLFNSTKEMGYHYDGSWLWNDVLWDRFYFSTYPQSGSFDFATGRLVNARLRPFRDRAQAPWDDPARFRGDGNPANAANSRAAAKNLLLEGAFNVNSTSVEAWKAVLAGLRGVPAGSETSAANLTAPFSRTPRPVGGAPDATTGVSANAWNGLRNLSQSELNTLADELVLQVRRRGPFLSLADFVNRRLSTDDLALSGALQAAIDKAGINSPAAIPDDLKVTSNPSPSGSLLADSAYRMSTTLAGFPGYLLQGDVLSALGASLAARSDTFVIRTYGDVANPATGDVEGRAWCEAVVQRLPDYVSSADAVDQAPSSPVNVAFGRRYEIVGFRWLSPDDL